MNGEERLLIERLTANLETLTRVVRSLEAWRLTHDKDDAAQHALLEERERQVHAELHKRISQESERRSNTDAQLLDKINGLSSRIFWLTGAGTTVGVVAGLMFPFLLKLLGDHS